MKELLSDEQNPVCPNSLRPPGNEDAFQPDRPLKMVMFCLSDCLLNEEDLDNFTKIATLLLEYGADPFEAMEIAEWRYGKYPGEEADVWEAWHIVARAAKEKENIERKKRNVDIVISVTALVCCCVMAVGIAFVAYKCKKSN